jgi:hypothetical protein
MKYSSATGLSVHQTVALIMSEKLLDIIVSQPTTESMDRMTEQMAQMVAPVKTTAWGGLHGSLALVLDDVCHGHQKHHHLQRRESMLQRNAPLPRTNQTQRTYYVWNLMPNANSLTSS